MEKIIKNAVVVKNFVPVYTLYIRRNGRKITRYNEQITITTNTTTTTAIRGFHDDDQPRTIW